MCSRRRAGSVSDGRVSRCRELGDLWLSPACGGASNIGRSPARALSPLILAALPRYAQTRSSHEAVGPQPDRASHWALKV